MEHKYKIAGLGEILWDIYDDKKFLGGAPANFAAHISQSGHIGMVLSRVGDDDLGKEVLTQSGTFKLDVSGLQIDNEFPTGTVQVSLDSQGVPHFQCSQNVAFDHLVFDEKWETIAPKLDAVLFGTLAQRRPDSFIAIQKFLDKAVNAVKVFDINLRGWNNESQKIVENSLQKANIIKLNEDELAQLKAIYGKGKEDIAFIREILVKYNIEMAAVTLGAKGCFIVTKDDYAVHPGYNVKVVDTTGSGDAFAAGFLIKYLAKASLENIAEYGNRLGAYVATQKGAMPVWDISKINKIGSK